MKLPLVATLALLGCGGGGQSSDCVKWVACWEALPGNPAGGQDPVYGPNGACWSNPADPTIAKNCATACKNALMAQSLMTGAPAACTQ